MDAELDMLAGEWYYIVGRPTDGGARERDLEAAEGACRGGLDPEVMEDGSFLKQSVQIKRRGGTLNTIIAVPSISEGMTDGVAGSRNQHSDGFGSGLGSVEGCGERRAGRPKSPRHARRDETDSVARLGPRESRVSSV